VIMSVTILRQPANLLMGFTSPELAEALALRRALSIASDMGYCKVVFAY
jgi:hypothetical protein